MKENISYYAFEKRRYETKGINEKLPLEYRAFLWKLIAELQKKKTISLDYLQIFDFFCYKENGGYIQIITHRQEEPEYKEVYKILLKDTSFEEKPIQGKVYCIDDGEQCTMLWAEEY